MKGLDRLRLHALRVFARGDLEGSVESRAALLISFFDGPVWSTLRHPRPFLGSRPPASRAFAKPRRDARTSWSLVAKKWDNLPT